MAPLATDRRPERVWQDVVSICTDDSKQRGVRVATVGSDETSTAFASSAVVTIVRPHRACRDPTRAPRRQRDCHGQDTSLNSTRHSNRFDTSVLASSSDRRSRALAPREAITSPRIAPHRHFDVGRFDRTRLGRSALLNSTRTSECVRIVYSECIMTVVLTPRTGESKASASGVIPEVPPAPSPTSHAHADSHDLP